LSLPGHTLAIVTGGELAAAAGVARAVGQAAKEDEGLKQQLRETAKDSPAMLAAADAHAKRVAVKQEILLKLFMPLAVMLGISRDYFKSDFSADMAEKIQDVPEDDLVSPKGSVAGPTMQALSYSLDEPDLKEMYLNLLATAVDGRRSDQAHPSFAQVIRQLTAEEARILNGVLRGPIAPIVQITRIDQSSGGKAILQTHVIDWGVLDEPRAQIEHPSMSMYIDNWIRLGLVTVDYDAWLRATGAYDWAETRPELERHRALHPEEGIVVTYERGILRPTDFGRSFIAAVG
jgi:hypothetical protein